MASAIITGAGNGLPIDEITATSNDILSGKKSINQDGDSITGTIVNRGSVSEKLPIGTNKTYPAGYYSSLDIQVDTLRDSTQATAAQGDILEGKTAWVRGNKITGTMPNRGIQTIILSPGDNWNLASGYYPSGNLFYVNDLSFSTPADATAGDIVSPKTAWVDGQKIVGTIKKSTSGKVSYETSAYIASTQKMVIHFPSMYYANSNPYIEIPTESMSVSISKPETTVNPIKTNSVAREVVIKASYQETLQRLPTYSMNGDSDSKVIYKEAMSGFYNAKHDSFSVSLSKSVYNGSDYGIAGIILSCTYNNNWTYSTDVTNNKVYLVFVPTPKAAYGTYTKLIGPYAAYMDIGSNRFAVSFRLDSFGNPSLYFEWVRLDPTRYVGTTTGNIYIWDIAHIRQMLS